VLVAEGMLPWWLKYLKWKLNNSFLFLPFNCSSFTGRSTRGDTVFDQPELSFYLGEDLEHSFIQRTFPTVMNRLCWNSRSKIGACLSWHLHTVSALPVTRNKVFPNVNLECWTRVKSFEKAKESWSMDAEEKAGAG
jgi:hypothetical protein